MDAVTGFESSSPKAEGEDAIQGGYDFGQVPVAMLTGLVTAETVFARCAKKKLRQDLGLRTVMALSKDGVLPHITYHSSVTVMLEIPESTELARPIEVAGELFQLTSRLSRQISESRVDVTHKVILIDALSCQILEVGPRCFSFRLGQKWGVE
jgi:hypothetical protein